MQTNFADVIKLFDAIKNSFYPYDRMRVAGRVYEMVEYGNYNNSSQYAQFQNKRTGSFIEIIYKVETPKQKYQLLSVDLI